MQTYFCPIYPDDFRLGYHSGAVYEFDKAPWPQTPHARQVMRLPAREGKCAPGP